MKALGASTMAGLPSAPTPPSRNGLIIPPLSITMAAGFPFVTATPRCTSGGEPRSFFTLRPGPKVSPIAIRIGFGFRLTRPSRCSDPLWPAIQSVSDETATMLLLRFGCCDVDSAGLRQVEQTALAAGHGQRYDR